MVRHKFKAGHAALLLLATSLSPVAAQAQTAGGQPAPAAAPQPQIAPNPSDFALAALRIHLAVEGGVGAQVWDQASPVLKGVITRDQFANLALQRKAVNGPLQNLQWSQIVRTIVTKAQGQIPVGEYLTVNFVGINKVSKPVAVTVSFILDSDRTWRLVGLNTN